MLFVSIAKGAGVLLPRGYSNGILVDAVAVVYMMWLTVLCADGEGS